MSLSNEIFHYNQYIMVLEIRKIRCTFIRN